MGFGVKPFLEKNTLQDIASPRVKIPKLVAISSLFWRRQCLVGYPHRAKTPKRAAALKKFMGRQRLAGFSSQTKSMCVLLLVICFFFRSVFPAAAFFSDFGIHEEKELGRKFDITVRSRMPLIEDPEIKYYVRSIVERLNATLPPQPFTFTTHVLLDRAINAFAVPGGFIFVHSGLIMNMNHESELAAVLAHEMAHITQRHIAGRIERSQISSLATLAGVLIGAFLGGSSGGALATGSMAAGQSDMLHNSRYDETEADHVALQYLVDAGYQPQGMVSAFKIIQQKQWMSGLEVPEYLSTHPDVGGRINEILARIPALPLDVRQRPEHDERFLRVKTLLWARYGNIETAEHHFRHASATRPLELMGKAMLSARRNRMQEAQELFNQALHAAPHDALIQREAGIFFYSIGNNRAESLLQQALNLDPKDAMARFFRARLLADNGNHHQAQKDFRELLKTYPDDAEIHETYGRSLGASGHTFLAYLHLAYSALYENNIKKTNNWLDKAKKMMKNAAEKDALERFQSVYTQRQEIIQE